MLLRVGQMHQGNIVHQGHSPDRRETSSYPDKKWRSIAGTGSSTIAILATKRRSHACSQLLMRRNGSWVGEVNMDEISEATKKAVRAAIKEARSHLKNCEMIMKGWVPDNRWLPDARWQLSDELHNAGECLWKGQEAVVYQARISRRIGKLLETKNDAT